MSDYNILVVGSISLSNKGTASIIVSTIESLQSVIPNIKLLIELFYPEQQRELIDIEKEQIEVIAPLIQSPVSAVMFFLLALLWYPLVRLRVAQPLPLPAFRRYHDADMIVDLSAEAFITYFDDDFLQQLIRFGAHLYPLLLGVLLDKPIVFYAETMAPFGIFRPLMNWLLSYASLVTVRDPKSLENLRQEGVDTSKVYQTADPAFLLESCPPPREPERRGKGPIIGLVAARQTGRTLDEQQYENLLQTLSDTAMQLIQKLDATLIFVPHSSGTFNKASDDTAVGLEMSAEINCPDRFTVIQEEWSPQQTKGFIGQCDALLSLRMHPVIAALSMGVPSVIIAFNDKAFGLMQMFGLEGYVCHIDNMNAESLLELTVSCLENKENIRIRLRNEIGAIQDLAMESAHLLKARLETQ